MSDINGLALEYQREYGTAHGNVDLSNLINNPAANGICRVLGLSLKEEFRYSGLFEFRVRLDDLPDAELVGLNGVHPLP